MRRFLMRFGLALTILFSLTLFTAPSFGQSNDVEKELQLLGSQVRGSGSYLGVRLTDIDADRAKTLNLGEPRGVEVTRVEPGSPAEQAGLKAGDVLLTYNGENIVGAQQLGRLVSETPQGRRIKIQYWRDGKMGTIAVTTGSLRGRSFEFPSGPVNFSHFDWPDVRAFSLPVPLVVWKDSMLGIECEQLGPQLGQYFGVKHGALVRSVEKGSPAEKAGIKAGDIITALGDQPVASPRDVTSYPRTDHQPAGKVPVDIVRDHKNMKMTVMLAENQQ